MRKDTDSRDRQSGCCPTGASCPFVADLGDVYLIIGATAAPDHAAECGGNVGDGETAILVPKRVTDDAIAQPLRDRIAELEAALAAASKEPVDVER